MLVLVGKEEGRGLVVRGGLSRGGGRREKL